MRTTSYSAGLRVCVSPHSWQTGHSRPKLPQHQTDKTTSKKSPIAQQDVLYHLLSVSPDLKNTTSHKSSSHLNLLYFCQELVETKTEEKNFPLKVVTFLC